MREMDTTHLNLQLGQMAFAYNVVSLSVCFNLLRVELG